MINHTYFVQRMSEYYDPLEDRFVKVDRVSIGSVQNLIDWDNDDLIELKYFCIGIRGEYRVKFTEKAKTLFDFDEL